MLHLQPMMAGPYPTAQSPEPLPTPRPHRHSWTYRSALSVTLPACLDSSQHPLSFTNARGPYQLLPRHQMHPHSACNSFRPSIFSHTFKPFLHSGALATSDTPLRPFPRLHSIFPFCIRRPRWHPQTNTARPQNLSGCQYLICFSVPHYCSQNAFW